MASVSSISDLENACANVALEDEEVGGLVFSSSTPVVANKPTQTWSLLGRILTDKSINFPVMQQLFASVWRPVKGVRIKDLGPNLFLFQFYNEKERDRIFNKGPWSFEQNLLIIEKVEEGFNFRDVQLFSMDIWVQIHDIPCGLMSEKFGMDVGNFIGKFVESDTYNFTGSWKSYMRIRSTLDVRRPLKRRMKVKMDGDEWSWINFKYERLPVFCFYCGLLGHSDMFCEKFLEITDPNIVKPYGSFLRAPNKRPVNRIGEKWLRFRSPERDDAAVGGGGRGSQGGDGGGSRITAGNTGGPEIMQVDLQSDKVTNSNNVSTISVSNFKGYASNFCGIDIPISSQKIPQSSITQSNKENSDLLNPNKEELSFTDPKRKRNEDSVTKNTNLGSEETHPGSGQLGSKNFHGAGSVLQTRQDQ
ncbi:hypothetical protein LguiB_009812 [Lonicera macranthoides]